MKNKSWKYPFSTFGDKMFDGNNDGKLDTFETAFRDAHLEEIEQNVSNQNSHAKNSGYISNHTYDKPNFANKEPQSLTLLFFSIIVLIGGIIFAFTVDINNFFQLIVLFGCLFCGNTPAERRQLV